MRSESLLSRLLDYLIEAVQAVTSSRVRALAGLVLLVVGLMAASRLLPAVYGRYALAQAALTAAQQVNLKGEDQVLLDLRRQAFKLGLTEAALDTDLFTLERQDTDHGQTCTVSYDFSHPVRIIGRYRVKMRIRNRVTGLALQVPALPAQGDEPPR
jgi:hypothetical protein